MRTNIEIDDRLMAEAMAAAGLSTKKATVEEALRRLIAQERRRRALADMHGMGWPGPGKDGPGQTDAAGG
ncbi:MULTISPECIES: type II toxin-antitoxin system VapB family antitoxin [Aurantimonas]|uniref:type II toxin-antitoxin system VapB family antitoxin n=1 Tax=Aurantimonas TaxID=182269 RepID=UPI0004142178|nr:type II toxin-antitoxin system VapB family antitoxin [Aurantimonas coralicida]